MKTLSLREMIDRLVAVPSVSAVDPARDMGNESVIDALAGWLEHEGWRVEKMPVADGKANLIATRGRGPGGLVLSGHIDTVPFDEERWSSDPFEVAERDGKLFGLGTCDMKSFLAMAADAARAFDDAQLTAPIILLATADEETGMAGARALVAAKRPSARYAVIGEPTGLKPIRMHKGCAMARLELTGQSGHSSDPALGRSALDGMHAAIGALIDVRDALSHEHLDEALHPPHATLNLGRVAGGDNPNRICASCVLDYDLRVLPGMDAGAVQARLDRAVRDAVHGRGLEVAHGPLCEDVPPFETDKTSELVATVESLTGHAAGAVSFGTEAPFLSELGMETVVLGPGDIDVAHQPDEHLALERIPPMQAILHGLIGQLCTG